MSAQIKFYVDAKDFGENADTACKRMSGIFPAFRFGVGPDAANERTVLDADTRKQLRETLAERCRDLRVSKGG